jgi:hypothetical protein
MWSFTLTTALPAQKYPLLLSLPASTQLTRIYVEFEYGNLLGKLKWKVEIGLEENQVLMGLSGSALAYRSLGFDHQL